MKLTKRLTQQLTRIGLAAVLIPTLNLQLSTAHAQGTAFAYQGVLNDGGVPATGLYDLEFRAFDAVSGGAQQGGTVTADDVPVTNGLFTATLDFGAAVFTGPARWLNVAVRPGASAGAYADLLPRQALTATPYAVFAGGAAAAGVSGTLPDARLSANVALRAGGNALTGNQTVMSGNAGIGTTTPVSTLDVYGSGSTGGFASPARALKVRSTASFGAALGVDASTVAGGKEWDFFSTGGNAAEGQGKLILRNDTDAVNAMTITTNGNVGIGTTTPASLLHVNGTATATSFAGGGGGLTALNASQLTSGSVPDARLSANVALRAGGNALTGNQTVMSGDVGIGTTSPGGRLHVRGTGSSVDCITMLETTGGQFGPQLRLKHSVPGGEDWVLVSNGSINQGGIGRFHIVQASTGLSRFVINQSGNVGLGTTTPGAKLHIRNTDDSEQGGIRFERAATGNYWNIFQDSGNALVFSYNQNHFTGTGYAYLTSTTFGLISTSDRRAKKDIEVMAPCLDRVMALKPTTFRYKSAEEGTPLNYGFIAQEIAEQFPDLVMERNGLKTLAAAGITAINTRAIQDLKLEKDAELAKLRAELSQLRSEKASLSQTISDMEGRFVRLEKAVNTPATRTVSNVNASADVK